MIDEEKTWYMHYVENKICRYMRGGVPESKKIDDYGEHYIERNKYAL